MPDGIPPVLGGKVAMMKWIVVTLVGLLILCVATLFWLHAWHQASQDKFALEAAKAVLQILVVVVLGTVVTLLTGEFSRLRAQQDKERDEEQRKAENLDELRKDLLQRLHQAYSDCKRTKRLLRAEASKPSYYGTFNREAKVNVEQYDKHLQALNDIQLDLEIMAKDADANHMAFTHSKQIAAAIRGMEETLKPPIREYEHKRGNLDPRNPPKVSDLHELSDIMVHRREGRILTRFTDHYRQAVEYIQQDIVRPTDDSSDLSSGETPQSS
jgi:uncharacterized membrane protein